LIGEKEKILGFCGFNLMMVRTVYKGRKIGFCNKWKKPKKHTVESRGFDRPMYLSLSLLRILCGTKLIRPAPPCPHFQLIQLSTKITI